MDEVRATLGRLEPMITRLALDCAETKAKLPYLATKEDVSRVAERVGAVEGKISNLPSATFTFLLQSGTVLATLSLFVGLIVALKASHLI